MNKIIREHSLEIFAVASLLTLAFFMGRGIGTGNYQLLLIIPIIFYPIIIFKKPELGLLIFAILIPNMFGIVNADLFRITGFFKLRDVLLIASFLPLMLRELIVKKDIKFLFGTDSAKVIMAFSCFILLCIIGTTLRHSYSFNLSLRIARDYFYYLFFFGIVCCIRNKKQLDFTLKWMVILSLILAIMYILQALGEGRLKLLPGYLISMRYEDILIGRSYTPFGFVDPMIFATLGLLTVLPSPKSIIRLVWIGVPLLLGARFFTLGRTGWATTLIGLPMIILFTQRKSKKIATIRLLGVVAITAGYLIFAGLIKYGVAGALVKGGIARGKEGVYEIWGYFSEIINPGERGLVYKSGRNISVRLPTMRDRIYRFKIYYENIVKHNPLFGVGFLYPDVGVTRDLPYSNIISGDCALISILNTMGIGGLLCYIFLYAVFIKRGFFVLSKIKNPIYKGFILGFIVWYIADWLGIMTSGGMTRYDTITMKALCVGITESMYKIDREQWNNGVME